MTFRILRSVSRIMTGLYLPYHTNEYILEEPIEGGKLNNLDSVVDSISCIAFEDLMNKCKSIQKRDYRGFRVFSDDTTVTMMISYVDHEGCIAEVSNVLYRYKIMAD